MLCPFCLIDMPSKDEKCGKCGNEIPRLYRRHYPQGFNRQPIVMSAVGFRGHGKTIYFASLLHVLENDLPRIWSGFYRQAVDSDSAKTVRDNLHLLEQLKLPDSTPQNFPRPNIQLLGDLPGRNERLMVIYDASGESFQEELRIGKFAGFLKRARAVLFLVSLDDLEPPQAHSISDLLETYAQGMARLNVKPKEQHLIVVYTKADTQHETLRSYPLVVEHLRNPGYTELGDLRAYRRKLQSVSDALEDYTKNGLGALNFFNMTQKAFKSSVYCAVSALGKAPEGGRLKDKMTPIRVVDPLLWMLTKG